MNLIKTLIVFLCCIVATGTFGQKKLLKKANNFYKVNQYVDAIGLYEQALAEKDNLSARTKLAYCYRMTNQMSQAETEYSKVVENPKAKPITYFYYAESLMSNEKYDLAKNWFLKYNQKVPEDKNAVRMAYACDKVKVLNPYFKNVTLSEFEHNSDVDDSSPLYLNGGIVFTSDRSSGLNPLKQKSGWTGRDYQRIYYSKGDDTGSFKTPDNFSKKLNDLNKHCGPVSFSGDGKTVVFTRTGSVLGKNNSYNIQLYSAQSEDGKKWKNVKLLPFCNNERNYMHPAISPDGKQLFFVSDKAGGLGGTDIYMVEKKGDSWGRPANLGPIINTTSNEAFPFFHSSGKLFFCSKGHLSFGGFDILFSNLKEDGTWQKPVNVGKPINSSYDDISLYLDDSMNEGMFASARNGGDDDIYIFKVMEGINAELESLDFEDLAEEEKPVEVMPVQKTEVNVEPEVVETNISPSKASSEAVMEDRLVKNMEGEIAEDKTLETIREETVATPTPVEVSTAVEEEIPEAPKVEEINMEVAEPEIRTEPVIRSQPVVEPEIVEQEIEKAVVSTPVVEEEPVIKEPSIRSLPEAVEDVQEVFETEEVQRSEEVSNTNEVSDLLIAPTPELQEEIEAEIPSEEIIIEEKIPVKEIIEEEVVQEMIEEEVKEEVSIEETNILDREPLESKPPVLMGTESSMLSDEVLELPRLAEFLETNQVIPRAGFIIKGLQYPTGSYMLSPKETRSLGVLLDLMKNYPELKVEIGSHTPSVGNDIGNHNLSRKRAMSIMAYLVFKGISNDRVSAKGYGETELLNRCSNGSNCSNEEHKENDRIEVKVMN